MRVGDLSDDPAIEIPASGDLWVYAACDTNGRPWSVQF
jgi:hypothetical protein